MRLWYLSHRRPVKAQTSLRIRAVLPGPLLFAYIKYESRRRVRPKIRHLARLDGCACAFEDEFMEEGKYHNHEMVHLMLRFLFSLGASHMLRLHVVIYKRQYL